MALKKVGVELVAANESGFLSALARGEKAQAAFGAVSEKVSRALEGFSDAAARAGKIDTLSAKLATQRQAIASLEQQLARASALYGESSTQAQRAAKGLEQLTTAAQKTESEIKQLGGSVPAAGAGFTSFSDIATGALRKVGEVAIDMALQAGQAIGGFVADSVSKAGDFEAGMLRFGAAAGSALDGSGQSLDDFKQLFLDLGKELPVSTAAVQDAAVTLVKGGLSPATLAAGALKDSLQFAAAADMDLNKAAELSIKTLGTFGPAMGTAAEQTAFMAEANDLLVKAAGASTLDVDKLGDASLEAAGAARSAGVDYKDFITTMGLISPTFGSASEAATSYRNLLVRLQPSTKPAISAMQELGLYTKETGSAFFDATGKFVGNRKAAELLQGAFKGLSDAQRISAMQAIFGNDAMGAANALVLKGAAGYDAFAQAMAQANGVQAQAATVQQGFNIALDNAGGSVEAFQIALGTLLLPVLTNVLNNGIAPLINGATDFVTALGDSSTTVGMIADVIGSTMVPALYAATAATIAYGIANSGTLGPALLNMVVGLAKATAGLIANAAAAAAAAWPYAAIALAVGGMAWAYQDFQSKIAAATDALLESRTWWTDSADAMDAYQQSGDAVKQAAGPQAKAIEQVRTQLRKEVEALGEGMAAGTVSEQQRKQALISINSHANTLKVLTGQVNDQIAAQNRAAAATQTGTAALAMMQSGVSNLGPVVELTEKEIEKLGKAIEENFSKGGEALGAYAQTEASFFADAQSRRAAFEDKIAGLIKDKEGAKTQAQRDEIQQRIDAERSGYAEQEQAAAESYARQQAAQNAHLGQMLIDYVVAQSNLGNIAKDKAAELVDGITEKFDVQGDSMAGTYIRMTSTIDAFAQSSQGTSQQVVGDLVAQRDAAVDTQQAMDAAAKDYTTTITAEFIETGDIEAYQEKAHQLPDVMVQAANDSKAAFVANTADFEMLGSTSVDYIATGITNGTPNITTSASVAGASAADAWASGIASGTPAVQTAATTVADATGAAYVASSADFEMLASTSAGYLATGIAAQTGPATEAGKTLGTNVASGFEQGAATAPQAGTDAGNQINQGIAGVSGTIQGTASEMGAKVPQGFASGSAGAQQAGATAGTQIATGMQSTSNAVQTAGKSSGESAVQGAASGIAGAPTVGQNFSQGFAAGITAGTPAIQNAARGAAASAMNAARTQLDAHSPSRAANTDVGQPWSLGVAGGILEAAPAAEQAAIKTVTKVAKAGAQLLDLQKETNAKLLDVQRKAGEKLLAIDAKVAADRKAAIKDLYQSMNSDMLQTDFSFIADNLDEFEAETDEQKNQYKIREEAQRQYQERMRKARDEARQQAKDGDAELAKEVLAAKEKEASDLMVLDQKYMELRASVDKKQLPELEKRYQAAVDARREQTSDEIAIANSASQQRQQAVEDEKAVVVSEAQQATNEILTEAQAQAAGVKGATAEMVSNATSGWHQIVSATNDATAAVARYNAEVGNAPAPPAGSTGGTTSAPTQAGGGGMFVAGLGAAKHIAGISAKAGGGGSFVANKPMKVLVGEAGPEMINVVPLGKPGKTKVGSGWAKMGGGGTGLASFNSLDLSGIDPVALEDALKQLEVINHLIDQYARQNKVDPGQAKKYADTVDIIAKALTATVEIRRLMKDTGQPLDMAQMTSLIDEATGLGTLFVQMNLSKKNNIGLLKEYGEAIGAVFDVIHGILEMRKELKDIPPAFDLNTVMILADETRQVIRVVQQQLVKLFQEEREDLANAGEAIEHIVGILSNIIDLRSKMEDIGPPVVLEAVQSLLDDAQATLALARSLRALTTDEGTELEAAASQVDNAISIITNMADLREKTEKVKGPIDPVVVESLLAEVAKLRDAVARLIEPGEQTIDGLDAYADTVEKATGIFTNILDLREKASSLPAPISDQMARSLIYDLQKIVAWFTGNIIPLAEAVVQYSEDYSTVAGQATDALSGVFDIREKLAAFPTPMSDQAVIRLIHDLQKLTIWFAGNILPYAQDIVDNVDRYGQLAQTAIGSFSDAAELGAKLQAASPIPIDAVQRIATEVMLVASVFRAKLLDTAQETVDLSARYSSSVKDAIDTLQSAAELGNTLKLRYPIDIRDVRIAAANAMLVADVFRSSLLSTSQDLVDLSDKNSSLISNAISSFTGVVDLSERLRGFSSIPVRFIIQAAADARRIAELFQAQLIPASEEQAAQAEHAASIISNSTQAISDVLSLGSKAFEDYHSPSDAILDQAFADADRLMQRMQQLSAKYEEAGTTSAANLADALSKTAEALGSIKEMVLSIQPGANFTMDTSQLAQFEQSAGQLIMVAGRLGALAASVETTGIGGIPAIAESMNSVIDTLGRGGALDWSKVQQASAFFGGMGRMVSPPPSSSTIANSYTYNNGGNSSNVTINSNLGVAQIRAVVRQEMAASGRTAYSRKSMR